MHVATAEPVAAAMSPTTQRYAKCIETSKRVRWDIDRDVIRGRDFDFTKKFMPDGLSKISDITFLRPAEARFLSQVQGRTYANMFALVERFIGAKTIDIGKSYALGDQIALEALVRFADEEIKHQLLFRKLERMTAVGMPPGYVFHPDPDAVASVVLSKSDWAVLALTLDIEIFSQAHYRASIEPETNLSELWKDVFLFHWKEESQHAIMDEIEWRREDRRISDRERDQAVGELIELVGAVDGICVTQAKADAEYFIANSGPTYSAVEQVVIHDTLRRAYRSQYIVSGAQEQRFGEVLTDLTTEAQRQRIGAAMAPIVADVQA